MITSIIIVFQNTSNLDLSLWTGSYMFFNLPRNTSLEPSILPAITILKHNVINLMIIKYNLFS